MEGPTRDGEARVPMSGLAVAAMILNVPMFILPFVLPSLGVELLPCPAIFYLPSVLSGILAVGLGAVALVSIEHSGGRLAGRQFAVGGIVIPILAACSFVLLTWPQAMREVGPYRSWACGANLSGLGKAMVTYANDHEGSFPCTGGKGTSWASSTPDWTAADANHAFVLRGDGQGGRATVGSSLYLLVRYAECTPQMFVCKGDSGTRPFEPERYPGSQGKQLAALWDFGPEPWRHCSYAYQWPFGGFALTTSAREGTPVAADRSPWIVSPRGRATDFDKFRPDDRNHAPGAGTSEEARYGNSPNHQGEGQNVLYVDTHVDYEVRSFVGIDQDNIYTRWDGTDKMRGSPPDMNTQPADKDDAVLINDPAPAAAVRRP